MDILSMEKAKKNILSYFTSIIQLLAFSIFMIIYMVIISSLTSASVLIIPLFILPFLGSIVSYKLVRNNRLRSNVKISILKSNQTKLVYRMIAISTVLLIGYVFSKNQRVPLPLLDLLNNFGVIGEILSYQLTNIFFYLLAAMYPLTYAIIEYFDEKNVERKTVYGE